MTQGNLRCRVIVAALAVAAAITGLTADTAAARHKKRRLGPAAKVQVLSNRADLISGGDALVAIRLPARTSVRRLRITANGRNVGSAFAQRPDGRYEGLLTGLVNGPNRITASLPRHRSGRTTIVNHPIGGPVFSGPQMQPWVCQNGSHDPQCNAPTKFSYEYMSSVDHNWHSYDPASPPPDVATTTTQNGQSVPFIIRIESGYIDRDQYQIAVLYQPGKPWAPWAPQPQFAHKLLVTHGTSCGIDHESGSAPSVKGDINNDSSAGSPSTALGLGFAVMSNALDNAGHNCNLVTEAESLVMTKEHLIESYGTLHYTIGTGCSGGSLVQQQVANAFPGIYQGILPQCSFPDAWSTGQQLAAYHLDRLYFENPTKWSPGVIWTPDQIAAVEGHPNHGNAIILDSLYWTSLGDPTNPCAGVTDQQRYDPQTNPNGTRCTLADDMINVFGPRPQSIWTPNEQKIGHGFAGLPLSDVGAQFGLEALMKGQITPDQFVDLNAKIGGADIDLHPTAARVDATEPALTNDYRSGGINETNNLVNVPIIDLRGPDPGAFHDAYRSWTIRARLENQEGHFPKNDVIWFGQAPLIGDPNYTTQGLMAMDRWLSAIDRDRRNVSLAQKVADDRPGDVHDRCSSIDSVDQVSLPGVGQVCQLRELQTRFETPATVAGESIATDVMKCQLKPLRRSDYYPVMFSDAQWAQLESAFPSGVCDWGKPGVDQRNTIPWLTYQDPGGNVVYGGRPLGRAPSGSGGGWSDGAFGWWLRPSG